MRKVKRSVKFEIKSIDEATGTFEGYASVFGNADSYDDIVVPGAFKRTLEAQPGGIKILWQHNPYQPIGITTSCVEDSHGLKFTGKLTMEVQQAKECFALMKDKVVSAMSFGYDVLQEAMDGGKRMLKELKLYEISPVTFPANELALIGGVKGGLKSFQAKSLAAWLNQKALELSARSFEKKDEDDDEALAILDQLQEGITALRGYVVTEQQEPTGVPEPDPNFPGPAKNGSDPDSFHSQLMAEIKSTSLQLAKL